MYCKRCGTDNNSAYTYCSHCGARLDTPAARVRPYTLFAYRLISSPQRYRNAFLLLAVCAVCAVLFAWCLGGLGDSVRNAVWLLGNETTPATLRSAQVAWGDVWGRVLMMLCTAFVVFSCLMTAWKMLKIRRVFHQHGRTYEPLENSGNFLPQDLSARLHLRYNKK
jgi:predicted small integral membrane protein